MATRANYFYWPINGYVSIHVNFQRRVTPTTTLFYFPSTEFAPPAFATLSPQVETCASHPGDIYRRNASHLLFVSYREVSSFFDPRHVDFTETNGKQQATYVRY